eukprot:4426294-Amphidinium_carterae.1
MNLSGACPPSHRCYDSVNRVTIQEDGLVGRVLPGYFTAVTFEVEAEIVSGAICWVAQHGWRLLPWYTFDVQTGEWTHRQDMRHRQ